MKKSLLFLLSAIFCFSALVGCNNESEVSESSVTESELSETSEVESMNPEYWGDYKYETVENVGAPAMIESHEMTITRVNKSRYKIDSETEAGKFSVTLDEKTWSTFNLGAISLVDKQGTAHIFTGGSTDLEYVYRTQKTAGGKVVWSGGNHGNEVLVSLKFYDAETEQEIVLDKDGASAKVNKLHVIEKTKLLFKDDTDGDGYGYRDKNKETYTEDDVYAEVTRKYTFVGPQFKLNVDYKYEKDTYYQLSYTCMFPIEKKYGLYADMFDKDGNKVSTIETKKVGSPNYDGPMNSGNAATRAVMYSTTYPQYKFDVQVTTHKDSLENQKNSFKTAFWDMNTTSNKLYLSKYDTNSSTKVAAGSEFHTECIWTFVYDAQ